jgi:hypothetical protein
MGLQSTFFGPAKYGILPEMLRGTDLPRANGFFLMTTFLSFSSGRSSEPEPDGHEGSGQRRLKN